MDEMEIIGLHKRCNKKARKTSQPKKARKSSKSDESMPEFADTGLDEDEQKPKNASRSGDGENNATKAGKKLKRHHSQKKHQSHLNLLTQARKKKSRLRMIKRKNTSFAEGERRGPRKILHLRKKLEKVVFMGGPYVGHELSCVALYYTEYLRVVLKMSGLEKETKDLIKQALAKT